MAPVPGAILLHGDQTAEDLLQQALRLLDPDGLGFQLTLQHFDLSLVRRRETRNQVVLEAAYALRQTGYGVKAATITPEGCGEVGSPNAVRTKLDVWRPLADIER